MAEKSKKKAAAKKPENHVSVEGYKNKIITFLEKHDKKSMQLSELEKNAEQKNTGRTHSPRL
ncbi:MAG: hypothetical protein LUG26_02235 [Ruminococcus sp.]|nr:hypothetical protein [Ruminococcus sp.]